jgi:hypothetical protein
MAAQPTLVGGASGSPVEVRVHRNGRLKVCQWCDAHDDAATPVGMWTVAGGTRCEVHRLSADHGL